MGAVQFSSVQLSSVLDPNLRGVSRGIPEEGGGGLKNLSGFGRHF